MKFCLFKFVGLAIGVAIVFLILTQTWVDAALNDSNGECLSYPGLPSSNVCLMAAGTDTEPLNGRTPLIFIHGWSYDGVDAPPESPPFGAFTHLLLFLFPSPSTLRSHFKPYLLSYYSNDVSVPTIVHHRVTVTLRTRDFHFEFKESIANLSTRCRLTLRLLSGDTWEWANSDVS